MSFCLPTLGLAIPLKSGDGLVFNPGLEHCFSAHINGDRDSHCIFFHMKDFMPGGKDTSQPVRMRDQEHASHFQDPKEAGSRSSGEKDVCEVIGSVALLVTKSRFLFVGENLKGSGRKKCGTLQCFSARSS